MHLPEALPFRTVALAAVLRMLGRAGLLNRLRAAVPIRENSALLAILRIPGRAAQIGLAVCPPAW